MEPAPDHNLACVALAAAAERPDHPALDVLGSGGQTLTYHALQARVLQTASGLLDQGLSPGDRLLLRIGNTPDFPILFLAACAVGILPIPTSAALTRAEITAAAALLDPAAIAAAPGVALPDHPAPVIMDLAALGDHPPAPIQPVTPDDPAYIVLTSGTSGTPRAVLHAHRAMTARAVMREGWTGLGPGDRMLHAGAFNWTYTLGTGLIDPWSAGATALIPAPGTPPEALPDLLASARATLFAAAPGVFRRLTRAGTWPATPALRHGLSAGEKLPEATRTAWAALTGTPLIEAYGMSECSTFVSGSPTRPAPPGTLGFPQPGTRVDIRDGHIAIHHSEPRLMLGYLGEGLPLDGEWFVTGDQGVLGPDGALTYLGRSDDVLTAGGYRISPMEVEEALCQIPGVTEAAVVDHPLSPDTTVIAAHLVLARDLSDDDLRAALSGTLAPYKRPRMFLRCDALPRGPNGKLLRRALREGRP